MNKMNQYDLNREIEEFVRVLGDKRTNYTSTDLDYIRQYTGAGGQGKHGAKGEGLLYEFYTPDYICELMYKQALSHGYDGGAVLEPSIATGNIIRPFPKETKIVGFEINPTTATIAKLLYPNITVYNAYFETAFLQPDRYTSRMPTKKLTWLTDYPFSLVIGNPPYGKYKNKYSSYFKHPKIKQIEQFFMYYGLKLLKSGGLLVYITGSNFLRNGLTYNDTKEKMGEMADLIDAYRLPPVFEFSQVPTDILIFKKK
jgi:type I restriction-modification system DNA methylase subunit